jgi:hypothetical protein
MTDMNRRKFLGAAAAAPVAGGLAAEEMKLRMINGHSALQGISGNGSAGIDGVSDGPLKFTNFAKWLAVHGLDQIRDEARYLSGMDPDLLEMRLPFATKVRMQRTRNVERITQQYKRQFSVRGFINVWT